MHFLCTISADFLCYHFILLIIFAPLIFEDQNLIIYQKNNILDLINIILYSLKEPNAALSISLPFSLSVVEKKSKIGH